jgi:hypothetical protein
MRETFACCRRGHTKKLPLSQRRKLSIEQRLGTKK